MKEINSIIIGTLVQNEEFEDWWESELIKIPFFGNKAIKITFMDFEPELDPKFIEEANETIKNFFSKTEDDKFGLSELVYQNCMDFLNAIEYDEMDKPLWDMTDKNEVWKFVYPQDIYITRRHRRDQDIYLNISCNCEWEQEHGLQLVFRQGKKLTRISGQDGHITEADAFDKPDEKDILLSKFKE